MSESRRIILIRHGQVHPRYRGLCYGQSDVGLGSAGRDETRRAAQALAGTDMVPGMVDDIARDITHLYSSSRRRARVLAVVIGRHTGIRPLVDSRLDERHFGAWELMSWDTIYQTTGAAMEGMIHDPERFAPPGGETTYQMRDRVMAWYRELPRHGLIVAVAHGGPIAALRGTLGNLPPADWLALVPACGQAVTIS